MSRFLNNLLPLSLFALAALGAFSLSGCGPAPARTVDASPPGNSASASTNSPSSAKNDPKPRSSPEASGANGLDSLCDNHFNKRRLPVDKFERIKGIIDADKNGSLAELKSKLDSKEVTLNEASWGFYYLGLKSVQNDDFPNYVKYMTIAADDYLNPWAMVKLAKVYYYDAVFCFCSRKSMTRAANTWSIRIRKAQFLPRWRKFTNTAHFSACFPSLLPLPTFMPS